MCGISNATKATVGGGGHVYHKYPRFNSQQRNKQLGGGVFRETMEAHKLDACKAIRWCGTGRLQQNTLYALHMFPPIVAVVIIGYWCKEAGLGREGGGGGSSIASTTGR